MKLRTVFLTAAATILFGTSAGSAAPIEYVFDGTATGTLNGQTFTSVDLHASATTDTSDVPADGEEINFPTMPFTIDITGLGSTTVSLGLLGLFHNGSNDFVDFGWETSNSEIGVIEINSPAFTSYNMTTAIGPITETGTDPYVGNWENMSTTAGDLTVTSWNNVSFTAIVPEPCSLGLLVIGSLGMLKRRRT